ncbi:MAG: hypothetical protein ACE5GE_05785 [Phycisphaerae bacterium]
MTQTVRTELTRLGGLVLLTSLCMGAECNDVLPQSSFLNFEPAQLSSGGFCEDWGPGLALHPNETCFRREQCLFDCPQICEDASGNRIDSRDNVSPVVGTAPNGRCLYDMPWDPIGGFRGNPFFWGHAVLDILSPRVGANF